MFEFEPISATRIIFLMCAGAIFAAAGLYLMLRPKPEGAAKIEIFGLKFESSSAGLLVFVVGAAFLAVTLFVPEKRVATALPVAGEAPSAPGGGQGLIPVMATEAEVEPNDTVHAANQLAPGATVSATIRKGKIDWYVIDTSGQPDAKLLVTLRHIRGPQVGGELFNANERRVDQLGWIGTGAGLGEWFVEGEKAYLKVFGDFIHSNTSTYEVLFRFETP